MGQRDAVSDKPEGGIIVAELRTQLQLLKGGLLTTTAVSQTPSVRPSRRSFGMNELEPCAGELTTVFKARERRLHQLLEDRSRLGRDLHDSVLQSLYAIGIGIETSSRISHSKEAISLDMKTISQINQLIQEVRGMIRELESGTVQEFDLSSELNTLRTTYTQAGRLDVKLDLQRSAIEVLTHEEEREILNIVREALSNCTRHASATQAVVSIRMRDTRIRISISDDGIGFSPTGGRPRGYGLANMEARAKRLGGAFRVLAKTGEGTQIIVEFSLEPVLTSI